MSTVGFGNIASNTTYEKLFGVCIMIISALLYAAIFGHMTTIIQQMTSATVRYSVKKFFDFYFGRRNLKELYNTLKIINFIIFGVG